MKRILLFTLSIVAIVACSEADLKCEMRGMRNTVTPYGNACLSGSLDEMDVNLISNNIKENVSEHILSFEVLKDNRVQVFTSKKKKLNYNNGSLYLFKKTKGKWVRNSYVGTWIAD